MAFDWYGSLDLRSTAAVQRGLVQQLKTQRDLQPGLAGFPAEFKRAAATRIAPPALVIRLTYHRRSQLNFTSHSLVAMTDERPASPTRYKYKPLKYTDSIRILFLRPAPPSQEAIDVSLLEFRLGDPILVFNALSYTWQTDEDVKAAEEAKDGEEVRTDEKNTPSPQILCDGEVLEVTKNCHGALRHLRHAEIFRVLWVDAVCIDQSNIDERSAQISLMRRIYSEAGTVLVWLGEATSEIDEETSTPISDLGMRFMYDFAEEISDRREAGLDIASGPLYREFMRDRIAFQGRHTEVLSPRVRGLWEVLHRAWRKRLWTIQELALANRVSFLIGDRPGVLGNLEYLVAALFRDDQPDEELEFSMSFVATASHMFGMRNFVQSGEQDQFAPGEKALKVLTNTRNAVATDPRDNIYGVLGFFGDAAEDPHNIFPAPDYKKTAAELYAEVSRAIIKATGHLDVLSSCTAYLQSSIPNLPSWAASWNDTPIQYFRLHTFDAAAGSRVVYEDSENGRHLKIKGKRLDTVNDLRTAPNGLTYNNNGCLLLWRRWYDLAFSLPAHPTGQSMEDVFLATMCWGNDLVNRCLQPGDLQASFDAWLEILRSWEGMDTDTMGPIAERIFTDEAAFKFTRRAATVMLGRAVGVTEKSYLVMLPVGSAVGDEIVVLSGGRVPYAVRAEGDCYKLVGACYVHGVMDGEAFSGEEFLPDALEWFTLC